MSIANELSGDVAAAVLARGDGEEAPAGRSNLGEVIKAVHSTLREMNAEARRANRRQQEPPEPPPSRGAASGNS